MADSRIELIVMVSSFGGLDASATVLAHLQPRQIPAIILLTHLSDDSGTTYAEVLAHKTGHAITIARDKSPIRPGHVYLAPGGYHLLIEDDKTFALSEDGKVHNVRPSADVLFESLAHIYRDKVIAVVLTGANDDGAAGLASIYNLGGRCIIQSPETAVARSMPLAAIKQCENCLVVSLDQIAEKIQDSLTH